MVLSDPENSALITATTFNRHLPERTAILVHSETQTLVFSPTCHIASLEVYRGRDQAITISHDGLSLSDNGTLEASNQTNQSNMYVIK